MRLGFRVAVPFGLGLLLITLIPVGASVASATTSQWAANCALNLRSRPTTLSTRKTSIATGTVVTISAKVAGGSYGSSCKTYVYGSSWFAITAIGGRTVRSLYGVTTLYAASALFRSTTTASGYLEGIDVSEWQGRIDFAKVRASGRRFVIARATAGRFYTDAAYARNRAAAIAAGLAFTAYHYAQPDRTSGDAIREADHFIAVAGLKRGMLAPVLDLETGTRLGVTGLQSWVRAWLSRVYARLGVRATIYVTASFWQTAMGNTSWFANNGYHVVWVASWAVSAPTVPLGNWSGRSWGFWQYSDCGHVPGISGCVDLDRFHGTALVGQRF